MFTFTGEVPHSEIPVYIAAMDIAIIPDFNTYGSPMKLFEYMAMGKAIVAPDVPPIKEIVEEGKTALVFERKNSIQAVKCIEALIRDKELRNKLGIRARNVVLNSHTWDQNAKRIVSIVGSMV
jgi:glycosyltransferase involved in cell wall biosynthesis